jgi:hypothetical protein
MPLFRLRNGKADQPIEAQVRRPTGEISDFRTFEGGRRRKQLFFPFLLPKGSESHLRTNII